MSKSGALDLASGLGGKIDKEGVKSAVDEYVPLDLPSFLFGCHVSVLLDTAKLVTMFIGIIIKRS